jgi:c-di-GMP-binding flagellar brake protein YcgR
MMQIQRRFTRWKIKNEAKVRLEGAEAAIGCQINDISFSGLQLLVAQKLPRDVALKLNIILPDGNTLDVEVWVVWHKPIDGHNLYGLYFTKIKDQDKEKIYQFMRRYFPWELNKQWWKDVAEPKGGPEVEDRRIFARFAAKLNVKYLDLRSNREGKAQTVDVSAKGVGITSNEEVAVRTPVEMWFEMPNDGGLYYTRGEIVWTHHTGPGQHRAGVNLEKADLMGLSRVLRAA